MTMWKTAGIASLAIILAGCSTSEPADPSESPSATPDAVATNAAPTAAPSDAPTTIASGEYAEICGLLGEARDLDAELGPFAEAFIAQAGSPEGQDSPETIAAAQDFGQAMLDTLPDVIDRYDRAAELIDIDSVQKGLEVSSMLNRDVTTPFAQDLADAADYDDVSEASAAFDTAMTDLSMDIDPTSIFALNTFSMNNCGFALREM